MITWPTKKLGEVASIERSTIQPELIATGTAYLGLEHIQNGGAILSPKVIEAGELASSKFRFTSRHILYGKLRPYLSKIACPEIEGVCSTDILPILPGPAVDRGFLCHFLRQPSLVEYANARATGANLPRLSPSVLVEIPVPVPPLAEQERIAGILDKADGVRRKREEAMKLSDELLRSVFLDMFGDPVTNPKGWPFCPLGDGVESFQGGWNVNPTETPRDDGFRVLKVSAVTSGEYRGGESKSFSPEVSVPNDFIVKKGDLLISRANTSELVGAVAYVWATQGKEMLPDKLWKFIWRTPGSLEPLYVLHLARTAYFRDQLVQRATGSSGSMKNIGKTKMLEISIPYPPLEAQRKFSRFAEKCQRTIESSANAALLSNTFFASLQQRAFSGQL